MASKVKLSKGRTARAGTAKGSVRFIKAPPQRNMRQKRPDSAPRLFEWLTQRGYVEAVSTYRPKSRARSARRG